MKKITPRCISSRVLDEALFANGHRCSILSTPFFVSISCIFPVMRADSPSNRKPGQITPAPYQSRYENPRLPPRRDEQRPDKRTQRQQSPAQWADYPPDVPSTPTYASPRLAPKPPGYFDHYSQQHQQQSSPNAAEVNILDSRPSKTSLRSFFGGRQGKPPSVKSNGSDPSIPSHLGPGDNSSSSSHHPFNSMRTAPLPVVSSHDATEDEDDCPVCLEPLSFSFRLPGEKPHIVPECGHALHEVRYTFLNPFTSTYYLSRHALQPSMDLPLTLLAGSYHARRA